jgi:hypothetical protein
MAGLPDVERLARKLDGRRGVTLADLCGLYRASARLPLIEDSIRAYEGPHADVLIDMCVCTCVAMCGMLDGGVSWGLHSIASDLKVMMMMMMMRRRRRRCVCMRVG